jgi:galactokinase
MTRLESIKRYFKEIYPLEKECSVFYAPGRVNLIGGHTDYNGLPVLPLAINRSMLLALSPRNDNKIIVKSEDGYEPVNFEISDNIKKSKAGSWANYIKAAAQYLQRKEALWF